MSTIPPGLLPEGLRDRLPPEAGAAARLLRAVYDTMNSYGYDRVAPPMAEFEDALVERLKADGAQDLLRVIDPVSQRTLALRPDITAQVGRIAATRLANRPRPAPPRLWRTDSETPRDPIAPGTRTAPGRSGTDRQ